MIIDPYKSDKKVLRGILRGHDPTDVMLLMAEQYSNQISRIRRNCEYRQKTGDLCGQCLDVISAYEYAAKHLHELRRDVKRVESRIRNKWKTKG